MTKPNTTFKLSIRDVEIIEQALRNKAGRRGLAIAQRDTSPELKAEMYEIQEVLGRIHEQKNFITATLSKITEHYGRSLYNRLLFVLQDFC